MSGYLDGDDWAQFEKKFSVAYNWLVRRSLERELQHLRTNTLHTQHDVNRLKELEEWEKSIRSIEGIS